MGRSVEVARLRRSEQRQSHEVELLRVDERYSESKRVLGEGLSEDLVRHIGSSEPTSLTLIDPLIDSIRSSEPTSLTRHR